MEHYYFVLRLITCFLLVFLVGLERQLWGSSARLRANIIVCGGSLLFVSASFNSYGDDLMRISAHIISGIGFLGTGAIIVTNLFKKAISLKCYLDEIYKVLILIY